MCLWHNICSIKATMKFKNKVWNVLLAIIIITVIIVIFFVFYPTSFSAPVKRYHLVDTLGVSFSVSPKSPLELAKDIFDEHEVVRFSMVNNAYFPFAASWCCNTAPFGNIHQQVLFLTTDLETGLKLKRLWPNVSVVSLNETQFSGEQQYSKVGYIQLQVQRARYMLHLLQAGIRLLLFEVDCLWLSDPVPQLLARKTEGDIFALGVTDRDETAIGFLLLNPTPATIKLWQRLTKMMEDLFHELVDQRHDTAISESLNDQLFFTSLVKNKFAGVKTVILCSDLYPDGKWYEFDEKVRSARPHPILINNNWVIGEKAKITRARAFGHWFWNDEGEGSCNSTAVHSLFY